MLAALAFASLFAQNATQTVTLVNGATLSSGGSSVPYWGTSDTYIDSQSPLENNGDSHVLEGGPGNTILLKFGDLETLGRHKVVKATLFLTPSAEGKPHLASIRSVNLPWGEGPMRRPFFTNKALVAAPWSATWASRHSGVEGMEWQQSGATGPSDASTISGATLSDDGKEIAISGIEGAVQKMLDRWYDNNGFAIFFSAPTEFFSSKNVVSKPRLVLELADEAPSTGPDLSVTMIEAKYPDGVAWPPRDGTQVRYIAHVKNVGHEPATGFAAAWSVREHLGASVEVSKPLAPGQDTTVEVTRPYQSNSNDHRQQGLGLRITPKGADATANNDYLEIQEGAIPVAAKQPVSNYHSFSGAPEDGVQESIRSLNNMLAESKFSFAPEGVVERFRLDPANAPKSDPSSSQLPVPQQWLVDAGLAPYVKLSPKVTKLEGQDVLLDSADRWPGLLGGGSTANDISVPGEIALPYVADYLEVFDLYELSGTGLLAATEVAQLNDSLGKQMARPKLPGTIIVRALDSDFEPLPSTELRVYQSKNGEVDMTEPAFRLITGDNGSVLLPIRVGSDGKSDQFGGLQADGSNGVYLISATVNGTTSTTWLKAWQLIDSANRTQKQAIVAQLIFNVPFMPVDTATNTAGGATITDSEKDDAQKMSALNDGNLTTNVSLPNKKGEWIEIDLGKDQAVTQIEILGKDPTFWQHFDIKSYFTGETINQASPYSHEVDWSWNLRTRPYLAEGGARGFVYRGRGRGVRYIRFICREPSVTTAEIAEIRVHGAKN